MRKILLFAGAVLALAVSCTKTQVEEPGQEIAFQVARY